MSKSHSVLGRVVTPYFQNQSNLISQVSKKIDLIRSSKLNINFSSIFRIYPKDMKCTISPFYGSFHSNPTTQILSCIFQNLTLKETIRINSTWFYDSIICFIRIRPSSFCNILYLTFKVTYNHFRNCILFPFYLYSKHIQNLSS